MKNVDKMQAQGLIGDIMSAWNLQVPMMKRKTFDFMNSGSALNRKQSSGKSVH